MSIEAETTADIKVPPQPPFQQMGNITLDAKIAIIAPVKLTISRPTNQPFTVPIQKVNLQLEFNPQATAKLKYY